MKSIAYIFVACLITFSCSSKDDSGNNNSGGGLNPQATYKITFLADFTSASHPENYPENALFSKMMVVFHNENTSVFSINTSASEGLSAYAKDGDTAMLALELSSTEVNPTIVGIGNDIQPDAEDMITVDITPSTTFLSFVSKISPSPDWFVGVDSFNLVNNDNTLVDLIEIDLFAHDAGVDSGTDYTSEDMVENNPISQIMTSPFVMDQGGLLITPRLGILKIERIN